MSYIVQIRAGTGIPDASVEMLGGKAFQQALAAADGLPVPDAVVLTAAAFPGEAWLTAIASARPERKSEAVEQHLQGLRVNLRSAVSGLSYPLAVRSSATSEDEAAASFAGSFITKLNVKPGDLFLAIFDVWSSTFSPRIHEYMKNRGIEAAWSTLKMAVLIQPMMTPRLSGVGFSYPLGYPEDPHMAIAVTRGLGEALVQGEVDSPRYFLERGTWAIAKQETSLDTQVLYELAPQIGKTIEFLELQRNSPQDIEFVITPDLYFILLQNRPIATSVRG